MKPVVLNDILLQITLYTCIYKRKKKEKKKNASSQFGTARKKDGTNKRYQILIARE